MSQRKICQWVCDGCALTLNINSYDFNDYAYDDLYAAKWTEVVVQGFTNKLIKNYCPTCKERLGYK